MKKLTISSGLEIAYYDSGTGMPILFLHSFAHNKAMWYPQLTYFLERGYRVVAPDMPGHGGSGFDAQNHTVDRIAQNYLELLKRLDLQRVIVAGTSMGGYVALRMWARDASWISALILSNTKAEADTDEIVSRREAQIVNINKKGLAEFVETGAPKRLAPNVLDQRPWVLDLIKMMNYTVSAEANAATLRAMACKKDDSETLATIDVPTLIITGSDDKFIPQISAKRLKRGIGNSELHIIQDTGHVSSLENPTQYNQVMEQFLISRLDVDGPSTAT